MSILAYLGLPFYLLICNIFDVQKTAVKPATKSYVVVRFTISRTLPWPSGESYEIKDRSFRNISAPSYRRGELILM
jgi:hypothetical protein